MGCETEGVDRDKATNPREASVVRGSGGRLRVMKDRPQESKYNWEQIIGEAGRESSTRILNLGPGNLLLNRPVVQ